MSCDSCGSERILSVNAKCSDMFTAELNMNNYEGYVPYDLGIGGGDYIEFDLCLKCGKIQGHFPLPAPGFTISEDDI